MQSLIINTFVNFQIWKFENMNNNYPKPNIGCKLYFDMEYYKSLVYAKTYVNEKKMNYFYACKSKIHTPTNSY